ncbi:MAG TPA: histidine kinase [Steroidobacteraceae bacterium]|nr:histidine kinase [Steroidobacteraceae bacterium]
MTDTSNANSLHPRTGLFLPDFCAQRSALAVVLIAELVALVITLAREAITSDFWLDLAAISMFLLWIGLGCAMVLCRASRSLASLPTVKATSVALALMISVVALVSEIVFRLGDYFTGGMPSVLEVFPVNHGNFLLRNVGIGFIVCAVALRYFYVTAEWRRTVESEAQARIRALQARIRPHFLFNSMNTIAALTRSNPEQAEQAVEDLADLFRASLSDARQRITLREELEIARVYQRIEQLRLGERLHVDWQLDKIPDDAMVPSLLLQPLLENAIYHGIELLPKGGEVTVSVRIIDKSIRLVVSNPLARAVTEQRTGNRLALDNIAQRLELAWPGAAHVNVESLADRYTVSLQFPYSQRAEL